MKHFLLVSLMSIVFIGLTFLPVKACSTFCYHDGKHLLVAKNFDFYLGEGHIIINKRNVAKTSFPIPGERPVKWTSKYGSISFNLAGREFPFGGINEKGLVIEQMYLADTEYPQADDRAGVAELQWIQYQLDNSATVAEVLATDAILRISKYSVPIHFLAVDALGNVAAIEYVDGNTVVHTNSDLPVCALTNDTYAQSLNYFNAMPENPDVDFKSTSFQRFAMAGKMLSNFETSRPVDYSFEILDAVKQGELTKWSIVYDVKEMIIYFKTSGNSRRRSLHVTDFDFACSSPALYADIGLDITGPKDFTAYVHSENLAMVEHIFQVLATKPEFAGLVPSAEEQRTIANYPDTTHCSQ